MPELIRDATSRFSNRVDEYVKYRPRYQADVVEALRTRCGLRPEHVMADIGCGTGLSAEIFLQNGNRVIGVEPNEAMRVAGEAYLSHYPNFTMLDGSAERTGLGDAGVDFIVAGQAFHWFRVPETRVEFTRILRAGGWVVLVWHDRDLDSTPFARAYEAFLRSYSTDYEQVAHSYLASNEALCQFFAPGGMERISLRNQQPLDFEGLRGRLLSSSYIPREGERAEAMMAALPDLFSSHERDGHVTLEYETNIYYGHLSA